MKKAMKLLIGPLGAALVLVGVECAAAELLAGKFVNGGGAELGFSLQGESRKDIVGGEIRFGERVFRITGTSRLGLIGARRTIGTEPQSAEFAVLSSSFSSQTATGQPWVAAERYHRCDQPYNSFLALYRVDDPAAVTELGPSPYPLLVEELDRSDQAEVFCFMSRPPTPLEGG